MDKFVVPSLQKLAFEASFRSVIKAVLEFSDYQPGDKRPADPLLMAREDVIACVRDHLNGPPVLGNQKVQVFHLIDSTLSDTIRCQFVERFYKNRPNFRRSAQISMFLDCVLNNCTTELKIYAGIPCSGPDTALIDTIAKRSGLLKKLTLDLGPLWMYPVTQQLNGMVLSLSSLNQLTSLCLLHLKKKDRSILKVIGESCPHLTTLKLDGFAFEQMDVLALILGEAVNLLFLKEDAELEDVKLNRLLLLSTKLVQRVSPFCSSLLHLQLGQLYEYKETDFFSSERSYSELDATLAFVLRHLPVLQVMDGPPSVSRAIQFLHDASDVEQMEWPQRSPCFTDTLHLTKLTFVDVSNTVLLGIVAKMCPLLEDISFCDDSEQFEEDESSTEAVPDFSSIISTWTKVKVVTLFDVSTGHVEAILKTFCGTLEFLTYQNCDGVNLVDVSSCRNLESLKVFGRYSSLTPLKKGSKLYGDTFLPKLTVLSSDICLGEWTSLFEFASELTPISIKCCHIGISGVSTHSWSHLPKLWPLLQIMYFDQCKGLTMEMMSRLLPQLSHLKNIGLPERMRSEDPDGMISHNIMEKCMRRLHPVQITFQYLSKEPLRPFFGNENAEDPLSAEAHSLRSKSCEVDGSRYVFKPGKSSHVYYVPYSEGFP